MRHGTKRDGIGLPMSPHVEVEGWNIRRGRGKHGFTFSAAHGTKKRPATSAEANAWFFEHKKSTVNGKIVCPKYLNEGRKSRKIVAVDKNGKCIRDATPQEINQWQLEHQETPA